MKKLTPNSLRLPALAGLALGLLAYNVKADNWFDVNGTNAGYGTIQGGTYSWEDPNWAPAAGGTTATNNWQQGSFARFVGTNSYTITVSATETNAGLVQAPATGTAAANVLTINAAGSGNLYIAPSTTLTAGLPAQGFFCTSLGNLVINAPITGTGGINFGLFSGVGTITLAGNNTYSGGSALSTSSYNIQFSNGSAFGTGSININGTTFANLLAIGGAPITLPNNFTNVANSGVNFGSAANTPLTCTGPWSLGTFSLNIRNNGNSTAPLTLSGVISGSGGTLNFSANNNGTVTLSGANTYTGPTTLGGSGSSGVTLKVASLNKVSGGSPSSNLGAPNSVANGTIGIGSGTFTSTLVYTGAGETSDRVINLAGTTGGAVLQNDGSGPLILTSDFTATGAGAKTLTLQGNNTGANTLSGKIVNGSASTAVAKSGAGKWVLGGASTYTGGTSINQGTLEIAGSIAGGVTNLGGTLVLDSAAALNSSATLAVNSGTTVTLPAGATNIVNGFVIDGNAQVSGVWGPVGSAAPNQSAILQGTGYLNVVGKPSFVQQPVSASAPIGGFASFSVDVAGDPNSMTFQWQHNGVNIPGANSFIYSISPVSASDAGAYTCVAQNAYGAATSLPANLFVPTSTAYTSAILGDAPLSYWRLDETNGSLAYDLQGSALGTYVGSVKLNQAGFSTTDADPAVGLNANVAHSGVQVTNMSNFGFNVSTPFTMEGWIYFSNAPSATQRLLSTLGGDGWAFGVNTATALRFTVSGKADIDAPQAISPAIQAGVWYYIAVTFDPSVGQYGQYAFYFNGQPLGTKPAANLSGTSSTLYLGCNPANIGASEGIDGRIDEVAIYGYTLTDSQIANHFAARYVGAPPVPSLPGVSPATNYVTLATTLQENAAGANLSYQWFKVPSTPVGQNSSVLTLSPLSLSDAGSYYVQVSNGSIVTNSPTNYVAVVPIPTTSTDTSLWSLTNGLVLHLPFDGDYKDISGRGNNGTAQGAPSFVTDGRVGGKALHYSTASGSTNYVTLGVRPDLKFGANNFSVAFWVRQTAGSISTNLPFFGDCIGSTDGITNLNTGFCFAPYQADDTDGGGWMEGISDGTHSMTAPSQYTVFSDLNLINDGQWHHLVHVADRSGNLATYLDGKPYAAEAISFVTGSLSNANAAVIGQDPTGAYPVTAQADIDDLGVWKRTLTAFEVSGIYLAGHANAPGVSFAPVISVAAPVTITGISGTTLSYTGGAGSTFTLLSSPSANAPISSWTVVGTSATTPGTFTIPAVGSSATMFYRIKSQ